MIHRESCRRARSAFTMIEMLVVLAIIVLLASLTIGAVITFSGTGPRTATRSNLASIKAKLDNQWKAVRDKAQSETIPTNVLVNIQKSIKTSQADDPRIRPQYIQVRLTQAFPTSFTEVFTPGMGLSAWSGYVNYLNGLGINGSNASSVPAKTQNAICLMMILERGPSNPGVTPDALGSTAAIAFQVGPNQQQAFGCVDAWGNELKFTRNFAAVAPASPIVISTQSPSETLSTADATST